ncbi:hypothetical protein R1sor_021573 [Riccia sorocarpa]|uniref:Uncharacterized protein n=1 Tax=Riccia sorocarpa TaxID=122646 RepID=A0ABD3GHF2_9MARC
MKREGRVHGSCVRMRKQEAFDYHSKAPRKPTNHSRVTGACLSNKRHCPACHEHPVLKAMGKTKGKHKARDHDVTKNHRLNDFALGSYPPSPGLGDYYGDDLRVTYDSDLTDYHSEEEEIIRQELLAVETPVVEIRDGSAVVNVGESVLDGLDGLESDLSGEDVESPVLNVEESVSDCSDFELSGEDVESPVLNVEESDSDGADSELSGEDVDGWFMVGTHVTRTVEDKFSREFHEMPERRKKIGRLIRWQELLKKK